MIGFPIEILWGLLGGLLGGLCAALGMYIGFYMSKPKTRERESKEGGIV